MRKVGPRAEGIRVTKLNQVLGLKKVKRTGVLGILLK